MRQICLDTETTGTDAAGGDRIVEIGCVELDGRRFTMDTKFFYHTLVNPERDVPEEVVAIHGLSNEKLEHEPKFAEIAEDFLSFVKGSELIIHNAEFDVGFLNMELARLGKPPLETVCTITDSLAIARKQRPGQRNSLDALCAAFEIDRSARTLHGALLDAQLLAEVYINLTRGQDSLMIEAGASETEEDLPPLPDVSRLIVIRASEDELKAHEEQLQKVDKGSKGNCIWLKQPENAAAE